MACVAQNGLTVEATPWHLIDVLFIGGDDTFKLGEQAARLAHRARACGRWVHLGRVNSYRRLRYAVRIGCDSVDGTLLRCRPTETVPRLLSWLDTLHATSTPFASGAPTA